MKTTRNRCESATAKSDFASSLLDAGHNDADRRGER
jgi:hypothetical protein